MSSGSPVVAMGMVARRKRLAEVVPVGMGLVSWAWREEARRRGRIMAGVLLIFQCWGRADFNWETTDLAMAIFGKCIIRINQVGTSPLLRPEWACRKIVLMARQPRVVVDEGIYHVHNRG